MPLGKQRQLISKLLRLQRTPLAEPSGHFCPVGLLAPLALVGRSFTGDIVPFIQQIFPKCLLCAGHCSRCVGYTSEQNTKIPTQGSLLFSNEKKNKTLFTVFRTQISGYWSNQECLVNSVYIHKRLRTKSSGRN